MAAKKKSTKKSGMSKVGSKMSKTAKNVGKKVKKTGKNVTKAVGRGAKTAKTKTAAAFGAIKNKVKGDDEEE